MSRDLEPRGGRPGSGAAAARVEELYAQHSSLVLAICRGLLRDGGEAEDAAQQTFLSAQRALANGSTPREPVPWLAAIARNECLGRMRARSSRPVPTDDEPGDAAPDVHSSAVRREQVAGLRDALAELPEQQRAALLLREVRGLSYDEVADSLAVTTSAVESLIFRARRRLQVTLREAVTAISSPVGWLVALRDLPARIAGSGLSSPDVAKVVAVGVGAAAVAGGVTVTPHLERFGRTPPPATRQPQVRAGAPAPPPVAAAPAPAAPVPVAQAAARSSRQRAAPPPVVWTASGEGTESSAARGDGGSGHDAERETPPAGSAPPQEPSGSGEDPVAPAPASPPAPGGEQQSGDPAQGVEDAAPSAADGAASSGTAGAGAGAEPGSDSAQTVASPQDAAGSDSGGDSGGDTGGD